MTLEVGAVQQQSKSAPPPSIRSPTLTWTASLPPGRIRLPIFRGSAGVRHSGAGCNSRARTQSNPCSIGHLSDRPDQNSLAQAKWHIDRWHGRTGQGRDHSIRTCLPIEAVYGVQLETSQLQRRLMAGSPTKWRFLNQIRTNQYPWRRIRLPAQQPCEHNINEQRWLSRIQKAPVPARRLGANIERPRGDPRAVQRSELDLLLLRLRGYRQGSPPPMLDTHPAPCSDSNFRRQWMVWGDLDVIYDPSTTHADPNNPVTSHCVSG